MYGVGHFAAGKYLSKTGGKITREYELWRGMIRRCYSQEHLFKAPTYLGCTVSENFLRFQYFAEWCNNQIGFGNEGWHLDKDILTKGKREYSENNCVFIPQKLNTVLLDRKRGRGDYPLGVTTNRQGKFVARMSCGIGKNIHLGVYDTPEAAFSAYKREKERHVKSLVETYKDSIDIRVYEALMLWEIGREA